ncbi:MAG: DUF748 domain-containing protein [Burkholderiales bacterium]
MKKALIIVAACAVVIAIAIVSALHYASRTIENVVLEALGRESEIGEVKVRMTDVELLDIRVAAPKAWPSDTALRARRVVLKPKLSQLFSDRIELTDVVIEDAYISAARPREGGGLRVMPGLARKAAQNEKGRRGADISVVHLKNCTIDLYDATVAAKPQRIRLESVAGTVKDLEVPGFGARSTIDLTGAIKGPAHRGTVTVRGWVDLGSKSSELTTQVRGVDLGVFEPYIVHKTKANIDSGTFDLDLKATVRNNLLTAPGTLTIHSLKLQQTASPLGALAEIPRRAALGAVTDKEERIIVAFTLEGDLDDPKFSIAGAGALKTGLALLKAFGFTFEGLVRVLYLIVNGIGASIGAAFG